MALHREQLHRLVRTVLIIGMAFLIAGCPQSSPSQPHATAQNVTDPHWVYQASPHARVAVVFIHGIFGDADGTWTNADGKSFFQFLKEAPGVGDKVDIYAFGYASHMFKNGSLNINEAANLLDQTLENDGVWDYKSVVFVVHSMGGLVAMREIIGNPNRRAQVPLMVFYAVPQEGAEITNIADKIVNNPAIRQMFPADSNFFIQQLSDDWGAISADDKPTIICGYEKDPTYGALIVPWSEATRFCNGRPTAIPDTNHITIVKPASASSPAVIILLNALRDYVLGADGQPLLTMPDFTRENDHWVYLLSDPIGKKAARLTNNGSRSLPYSVNVSSDSDLVVWPGDGDIPARHTDQLGLALAIPRGNLQKEYSFVLSVPAVGDEQIVVRLKDVDAIKAQQDNLTNAVALQLSTYLSSDANVQLLSQQGKVQTLSSLAGVAEAAVSKQSPDLPTGVKWVLTADVLASMGISDPAAQALAQATQVSPELKKSPRVLRLGSEILAQVGKEHVFPTGALLSVNADEQNWEVKDIGKVAVSNLDSRSKLSSKMLAVPALKAYGLSLQGDVLQAKGESNAAIQAYKAANEIESSPLVTKKLDTLEYRDTPQH
jgi:pimeloyl-ACP methyl ester carboxylesterase